MSPCEITLTVRFLVCTDDCCSFIIFLLLTEVYYFIVVSCHNYHIYFGVSSLELTVSFY